MTFLYFDPGAGALVAQFLAAAIAGFLLFYRTVIAKIKSIFGIKSKNDDNLAEDLPANDDDK